MNYAIVYKKCFPTWHCAYNTPSIGVGRIWFCWDPIKVQVTIVSVDEQVITCHVVHPNWQISFVVSFVYARNDKQDRRAL